MVAGVVNYPFTGGDKDETSHAKDRDLFSRCGSGGDESPDPADLLLAPRVVRLKKIIERSDTLSIPALNLDYSASIGNANEIANRLSNNASCTRASCDVEAEDGGMETTVVQDLGSAKKCGAAADSYRRYGHMTHRQPTDTAVAIGCLYRDRREDYRHGGRQAVRKRQQRPPRAVDRAGLPKMGADLREGFQGIAADADFEYVPTAPSCGSINTGPAPKGDSRSQAVGRSRGGPSTKISVMVDALDNLVNFVLLPGQRHDLIGAPPLLVGVEFEALIADKAYDSNELRAQLQACGAMVVIPPRANRVEVIEYDSEMYKWRHLVENFFC